MSGAIQHTYRFSIRKRGPWGRTFERLVTTEDPGRVADMWRDCGYTVTFVEVADLPAEAVVSD